MKNQAWILALCLILFLPVGSLRGDRPGEGPLAEARAEIEKLILDSEAEAVGVAIYDLRTGQSLLLNERVRMHAASTMKLPVMMELFRLAKEGKPGLRQPVEVKNSFKSIIDGSDYHLSPGDDSDDEIYRRIGQRMEVIDLIDRMITRSSNLATNLLIELADPPRINRMMRSLGANEMEVLRGVEDARAFQAGRNNTATPYDLMALLRALAGRRFLDKTSCDAMIRILSAQQFNQGIPAGLPAGTKVAHKTGNITRHNHDAGIVYPPGRKPWVIVVMTKGIDDQNRSSRLIAAISRAANRRLAE